MNRLLLPFAVLAVGLLPAPAGAQAHVDIEHIAPRSGIEELKLTGGLTWDDRFKNGNIRPLGDKVEELSGILGGDDMAAKGEVLGGFFDATQSRRSESGAVSAGFWGAAPSGLGALKPFEPRKGKSGLILVGEKGAAAGGLIGGGLGATAGPGGELLGGVAGGLAGSKAEDVFNKKMDELGDKLRDRNDKKLQEGTQAQKDAEKKYGKK